MGIGWTLKQVQGDDFKQASALLRGSHRGQRIPHSLSRHVLLCGLRLPSGAYSVAERLGWGALP